MREKTYFSLTLVSDNIFFMNANSIFFRSKSNFDAPHPLSQIIPYFPFLLFAAGVVQHTQHKVSLAET